MVERVVGASAPRFVMFFAVGAGMIAPSALAMAIFTPELFARIDAAKLSLLALGITLPIAVFNLVVLLYADATFLRRRAGDGESRAAYTVTVLAALTVLPIYLPIAVKVLTGWGSTESAVLIALVVCVVQGLWIGALVWWCAPCERIGGDEGSVERGLILLMPFLLLVLAARGISVPFRAALSWCRRTVGATPPADVSPRGDA